jgi:hypothetical protein
MKKLVVVLTALAALGGAMSVAQAETIVVKKHHHEHCKTVVVHEHGMTKKIRHCH